MVKVEIDEIRYVESIGDYVKVHQENKVLVTRETISNIENKLSHSNKSSIVTIIFQLNLTVTIELLLE